MTDFKNKSEWPEFHQVAIHVPEVSHELAVSMLRMMGHLEWIEDEADLIGWTWNPARQEMVPSQIHGHMSFNYSMLGGRELEIISYTGDDSHHKISGTEYHNPNGFISHMSVNCEDAEDTAMMLVGRFYPDARIVHQFETFNHRNPAIAGKRRFKEVVLGTRHIIGFDIKMIQRLTNGPFTVLDRLDG